MTNDRLLEYFPLNITTSLLESFDSRAGSPMIIKGVVIQRANSKNRNGRVYPKDILKKELEKYTDTFVKTNRALGELDHSQENVVNLKNVSHKINNIYWDGDDVIGDVEILNDPEFPAGRIAAGLIKRRIPIGISSRGLGSVTEGTDGTSMVNNDFNLLCFDLVSFESTQGSNMMLKEGYANQTQINNKKIDDIIRELICNNSGYCPC
jgi:hypothetical protein